MACGVLAALAMLSSASVGAVVKTGAAASLARQSAAAVRGRVVNVVAARETAVDAIYSYVTIAVERSWGFPAPPAVVTLKLLGGADAGIRFVVGGQATFTVGEEVFVFVDVRPRDGTLSVAGLDRGKWTIQAPAAGPRAATRAGSFDVPPDDVSSLADLEALAALSGTAVQLPPTYVAEGSAPNASAGAGLNAEPGVTAGRWHEADWGVPVSVDSEGGGHPLFPGGGFSSLLRAIATWSGRSPLTLRPGLIRGPRCFGSGDAADGRISITYGDPCDEIADSSPVVALGGAYFSSSDVRTVGGTPYGRFIKGMVVLDNVTAKFSGLSTGCYEELLAHELGHAIGLGHTDDAALMSPWLDPQCVYRSEGRSLLAADLALLAGPYPPSTAVGPGPPGRPVGLTAAVSGTTVRLAWSPSIGPAPSAYLVVAGSVPGAADIGSFTLSASTVAATSVGRGIYYVRVVATNAFGTSPPSAEVVVVVGEGLPGTPVGLMAAAGPGGDVRVAWQAPHSGPPATGYVLLVGTVADRPTIRIPAGQPAFAARAVPQGTYFVRVVATNSAGTGPASPEIMVVVP
jgi:hypothetical protein